MKAKELARRFLEQCHSNIVLDAIFVADAWQVYAKVGLTARDHKRIKIDAETGRILDVSIEGSIFDIGSV